jgi:anti-sigma regulatory factor (Ser/Thr protein kinase)
VRGVGTSERRAILDLPFAVSAIRTARRWAHARLGAELNEERLDRALLVLSELVTNAVTHGADPVQIELAVDDELIMVRVTDHGGGTVTLRHPPAGEAGGRGLLIVDELAERWDVDYVGSSTSVWAQLARI